MNPKTAKAIRYHEFGEPHEVLTLEDRDVTEVGPGEVLISLLASPINPSDIGSVLGKYGKLRDLPATAGLEGIGEVRQAGASVATVRLGDRVRIPEKAGVWQELCVVPADELRALPEGLPIETASMASVNPPTAIRLLEDFGPLGAGDWVIQNGGNSNVGIAVVQYARKLGIRTVSVVRRESLKQPLLDLGADVVVAEGEPYDKQIEELTGGKRPRLALNSIGGESALRILNALSPGGTHVTFGAMSFEAVRFPTRQLIFDDVRICGFWLIRWRQIHTVEEVRALDDQVFSLIADGTFRFPVEAKYPLADFQKALQHTREPRLGKVLLTG